MDPLTLLTLLPVACTVFVITTTARRAKRRTTSYLVVEKYNTLTILAGTIWLFFVFTQLAAIS